MAKNLKKAKYVPESKMHLYEWSTGLLDTVGRKYVYYYVYRKSDNRRVFVKLKYDRKYDWEFEV